MLKIQKRAEAKRNLGSLSGVDPFEVEHILEYYSLVREGKPNCKRSHCLRRLV